MASLNHLASVYKLNIYQMVVSFGCFISQVNPTSILTFIICDLSIQIVTITPTIPARQNRRGWPKIRFWLPAEIQLLNREECEIQLEGMKPVTLQLKATCPETGATEGLKVIVPHISYRHSRWFWNNQPDFPIIWVGIRLSLLVRFVSNFSAEFNLTSKNKRYNLPTFH